MGRNFARFHTKGKRSDRQNLWIGVNINLVTVGGNSKVLVGVLGAAALALRPFTVVRTRLMFQVELDQTAASELTRGAMGFIVVSDQASAAGVASVPGPHTNTDGEFFVWEPFINSFALGDATGFVEPAGTVITVDSKAMRKCGPNEDVVSVVEVEGTPGAIINIQGRFLVKLH